MSCKHEPVTLPDDWRDLCTVHHCRRCGAVEAISIQPPRSASDAAGTMETDANEADESLPRLPAQDDATDKQPRASRRRRSKGRGRKVASSASTRGEARRSKRVAHIGQLERGIGIDLNDAAGRWLRRHDGEA